jgi:hypothetical protein
MSDSETMTAEPMEAVIISGPRKGEIITVSNGATDVSEEAWAAFDQALDMVLAAVERLDAKVEAFIEHVSHEPEEIK